ncbi:STAS domain protein [Leptospira fletcheri]|uniref:STAS domain protein n=1 Tax=Leptospira fletcheri TaxID=2484981 RepID=A0A4R9GC18_9LEPT|nr:STAS domain protein [Leptospira fletcheri]TGK08935.1 STAS domain protein [Leptospira fletcheri]
MKELIVNLEGKLDLQLGAAFREKIGQVLSSEPYKILLDASGIGDWELGALDLIREAATSHSESKFAVCNLVQGLGEEWKLSGLAKEIPTFSSREDAKSFLNRESDAKETASPGFVACPICFQTLRVQGKGNYRCPACSHTFYLTADYRTASFEKLF